MDQSLQNFLHNILAENILDFHHQDVVGDDGRVVWYPTLIIPAWVLSALGGQVAWDLGEADRIAQLLGFGGAMGEDDWDDEVVVGDDRIAEFLIFFLSQVIFG